MTYDTNLYQWQIKHDKVNKEKVKNNIKLWDGAAFKEGKRDKMNLLFKRFSFAGSVFLNNSKLLTDVAFAVHYKYFKVNMLHYDLEHNKILNDDVDVDSKK